MKRFVERVVLVVTLTGAIGLSACGSSLGATTTCATYSGLSSADKAKAVAAMQAAHHDTGSVTLGRASVATYCFLHSGTSQIQGIYGG